MDFQHRRCIKILPGLAVAAFTCALAAPARDHADERLKSVMSVFVSGNNQAAEGARQALQDAKTCLTLATKAADADAVLDISADTQRGAFGDFGGREWIASGTLTLKSGDLVWSHSQRFSDAPLKSGGKTAGSLLVHHLADSVACKERRKN